MSESLQTRWSMLEQLRGPAADEAWRWFIERYRGYVQSCLRRIVRDPGQHAAAAPEVWSHLFTAAVFERADRSRRFRSYLAGVIRNFGREWLRQHAAKTAVEHEALEPWVSDPLPEEEESGLWATHVVRIALDRLEQRAARSGRVLRLFYGLDDGDDGIAFGTPRPVSEIARELEMAPNAVHQALHRGRIQLRSLVEAELRQTVCDSESLADEFRSLCGALAGAPGLVA